MSEEHQEEMAPVVEKDFDNLWHVAKARWLNSHIAGSVVARETEALNHVNAVIDKLWEILKPLIKE